MYSHAHADFHTVVRVLKSIVGAMNGRKKLFHIFTVDPVVIIFFFKVPKHSVTPNAGDIGEFLFCKKISEILWKMQRCSYTRKQVWLFSSKPIQLQARI